MNKWKIVSLALAAFAVGAWAGRSFTKEQLEAKYYYDLGPSEINVSEYPEAQKANYQLFVKTCSQCHTLARPINSPYTAWQDWRRYITRMQERTKVHPAAKISKKNAKQIADFLSFDAHIRKEDKKEEFEVLTDRLKELFKEIQMQHEEVQKKKSEKGARPSPPYTGDKP